MFRKRQTIWSRQFTVHSSHLVRIAPSHVFRGRMLSRWGSVSRKLPASASAGWHLIQMSGINIRRGTTQPPPPSCLVPWPKPGWSNNNPRPCIQDFHSDLGQQTAWVVGGSNIWASIKKVAFPDGAPGFQQNRNTLLFSLNLRCSSPSRFIKACVQQSFVWAKFRARRRTMPGCVKWSWVFSLGCWTSQKRHRLQIKACSK